MKLGKTIYVTERKQWRSWLFRNHNREKEIWLIYYKQSSGKPRIPYNDAVEEALCYGWIDSTAKKIDEEKFAQRFTPRRPTSVLSEMNKERIRRLIKKKVMTAAGLKAISHVFIPGKKEKWAIAPDIVQALQENSCTWDNFQRFSRSYQRIRIGYLESQRRHNLKMFKKSLSYLIKMTAKNKKFGMIL